MKTDLQIRIKKIIDNIDQRLLSLNERMNESSEDFISYFTTSIKKLENEKLELLKELTNEKN